MIWGQGDPSKSFKCIRGQKRLYCQRESISLDLFKFDGYGLFYEIFSFQKFIIY